MKYFSTFFSLLLLASISYSQVQITNTSIYKTLDQMLLANEINESGEPYAEAIGYNLDDLDPFVPNSPDSIAYTLGINNYEFSRYQLGVVISRSGIGLHMIWAPMIQQMAAMEIDPNFDGSFTGSPNGFNEDDELIKNIMHFSMLANQPPPANPFPQFAEFISGDPHIPQPIDPLNFGTDFATLRWNRNLMDKTLNPAAMGQTLMKQYLWAQDMLGGFHDSDDNGIEPDGIVTPDSAGSPHFDPTNNVFYGGNNLDGFVGQVLTAEGINKVFFVINNLAYDGNTLGAVDPMTYDPANGIKYFPTKISVTEDIVSATMPPKPGTLSVVDSDSYLFDQLSFLWGTLNFKNMMDPDNSSDPAHLAYHTVFDGDPFPQPMAQTGVPGPFDLMKGASAVISKNIFAMHFDEVNGTFVDKSSLVSGSVLRGDEISSVSAGYIIVILKLLSEEFVGTPLVDIAINGINAQANFLINSLKNSDGSYANSFIFGTGKSSTVSLVESQSAAIRGLYAAYEATGNTLFLTEANSAYDYLISNFYSPGKKAFYTSLGNTQAVYTPFNVAIISGAMREARLVGNKSDAPLIYTRFFNEVGNVMQLSEGESTGESGNDSDGDGIPFIPEQSNNLASVFATEATLDFTTSVDDVTEIPNEFTLEQNFPNPFNPTTKIKFSLPENQFVSLKVYNLLGQEVVTLVNENKTAGSYDISFNASNLSSGVYLYRIDAGSFTSVKKLTLLK
ncbi:MAG: T9SS type A sorting domain-containing protein [Ignavibacteriaceae bacterium]